MTGVLLLLLFHRRLGAHQAARLRVHSSCSSLLIASSLITDIVKANGKHCF